MEKLPLDLRKEQSLAIPGQAVWNDTVTPAYPGFAGEKRSANAIVLCRQFVRRWKWTLILCTLLGSLAGIALTLVQPTLYQARASLEIQDVNDTFLNLKQFLPVNESDGPANTYGDIQTQIKILQSNSVIKPVADRMPALEASSLSTLRPASLWPKTLLGPPHTPSNYVQLEAKRMVDNFAVRAVGQTRIIELTAESTSPRLANDFLNEVCAEYIEKNIKARYEMGQNTSQVLGRLLDIEKLKLRQSEDALQNYARTSGLVFTAANKNVAEEKLSQVQDELSKAEESRIAAQSRYEVVKQSSPTGLPDGLSEGSVRDYKSKLTQLRQQRADMAAIYTADYDKIKRLEAQINTLEAAVGEEEHDVLEQAENAYHEALRREKLLTSSYTNQSAVVSDLAKRAVQYNILQREAEGNRQSYDEMLKQVKEATVAAAIRTDNVRVVDEATPPPFPRSPKPILNCALGFLMGSSLGLFFAFFRERSDLSLREPGDAFQYLGLTELGSVVHVRPMKRRSRKLLGVEAKAGEEFCWVIESYRAIVTSLLSEAKGNHCRLLVVTSPGPGEGKTTVTANLGLMLAAIGRRVLLIDADTRKPRLDEVFYLSNDYGLSTLLEPDVTKARSLADTVQKTSKRDLSVLTSGPPLSEPANLLHSAEFQSVVDKLRKEYEFVLVDTPPVLPVADARVIGAFADGVIFVVRARQTTRDAAELAHARLGADGIRVVGVVLNDWDPRSSTYNYYAPYAKAHHPRAVR